MNKTQYFFQNDPKLKNWELNLKSEIQYTVKKGPFKGRTFHIYEGCRKYSGKFWKLKNAIKCILLTIFTLGITIKKGGAPQRYWKQAMSGKGIKELKILDSTPIDFEFTSNIFSQKPNSNQQAATQVSSENALFKQMEASRSSLDKTIAGQTNRVIIKEKTLIPNINNSCWLTSLLNLANTCPQYFTKDVSKLKRNKEETIEGFENRKKSAALIIEILKKSREGKEITKKEIENLLESLYFINFNFSLPQKGLEWRVELGIFFHIFEIETFYLSDSNKELYNACCLAENVSDEFPYRNPFSLIGGKPLEIRDGRCVCPYSFPDSKENAPPVMYLLFSVDDHIDIQPSDFKCILPCSNDTSCEYELAAAIINVGPILNGVRDLNIGSHYYILINEGTGDEPFWFEYNAYYHEVNDKILEQHDINTARERMHDSTALLYRRSDLNPLRGI